MKMLYKISHFSVLKALALFALINFADIAIHILGFYQRFVFDELDYFFYVFKIIVSIFVLIVLKNNKVPNICVFHEIPYFIKGIILFDLLELYFSLFIRPLSRKMVFFFTIILIIKTVFELLAYLKLTFMGRANEIYKKLLIIINSAYIFFLFCLLFRHGPIVNYIFFGLTVSKLFFTLLYLKDISKEIYFCGPLQWRILEYTCKDTCSSNSYNVKYRCIKVIFAVSIIVIAFSYPSYLKDKDSWLDEYRIHESCDENGISYDGKRSFINQDGEKIISIPWVVTADVSSKQKIFNCLLNDDNTEYDLEDYRSPILKGGYSGIGCYFINGKCLYYSNLYKKYGMFDSKGNLYFEPSFLDLKFNYDDTIWVEFEDHTWNVLDENYEWLLDENINYSPYENYSSCHLFDTYGDILLESR